MLMPRGFLPRGFSFENHRLKPFDFQGFCGMVHESKSLKVQIRKWVRMHLLSIPDA
jgi:hypothetical protein